MGELNTQKAASPSPLNVTEPFGDDDYWYPVLLKGKCGVYNGEYRNESDATVQFRSELLSKLKNRSILYYYTDFNAIGPFCPGSDTGMAFWEGSRNSCLSPSQMNAYYMSYVNYIINNKPAGKGFCNVIFTYRRIGDLSYYNYYHIMERITYGLRKRREAIPEIPCIIR